MLSKNKIKQIKQLNQKKYRDEYGIFVVEGKKSVNEFLKSDVFELDNLYHTKQFLPNETKDTYFEVSEADLKKISFLKTPQQVVAVFKKNKPFNSQKSDIIVALDSIQDPGNLGTIIRLCDWFGIYKIVCSVGTVDCYNPKVIQATMGSLNRVELLYTNLTTFLKNTKKPIYAAIMNSENVYQSSLSKNAVLLMGNEANGISKENLKLVTHKIAVPRFGDFQQIESLNVATATAILLSEFKRNSETK